MHKIIEKTLVYMWNSTTIFQQFFASTNKIFILEEDWALGYNSMMFWDFPDLS